MAEYTITIKDEESGVSIAMQGPSAIESPAEGLAHSLVGVAPKILAKISEIVASKCDCERCQATRELNQSKPTLH